MDTLTPDQEVQLSAVMVELGRLTTPSRIYESARLRLPDTLTDADKKRFRKAFAGVVAAAKIQTYMALMRNANSERLRLGTRIRELNETVQRLQITDPMEALRASVEMPGLSGLQEAQLHIFVIAINAIQKLLPYAAAAAGHSISKTDQRVLLQFEPLRDYYEHIEQRLPEGRKAYQAVKETDDENGWRIIVELPTDTAGRVLIEGNAVDVSSGGVSRVQNVVERNWEGIKQSALDDAEKYFRANPSRIPHPSAVDSGFETKVGGPLGQVTLFQFNEEDYEQVGGIWLPVRQ